MNYDAVDWSGPARIYERLAHAVVGDCPVPLPDALVLDVGAGTGVVGAVAAARGARVIASDLSMPMLRQVKVPSAQANVDALPFRPAFDAVLGGCLINHFDEPASIIAAIASAVRPDGAVVLSAFPRRPDPVKEAIDHVARTYGFEPPDWYRQIKALEQSLFGTIEMFATVGRAGGLEEVHVFDHDVSMAGITAEQAVTYRLGLAHLSTWLGKVPDYWAAHVREQALAAVEPLVATWAMPLIVLAGRVG